MLLAEFEVIMPAVTLYREGDDLVFEFEEQVLAVPIELCSRLTSDRRLIDAVKQLCMPNIRRKESPENET